MAWTKKRCACFVGSQQLMAVIAEPETATAARIPAVHQGRELRGVEFVVVVAAVKNLGFRAIR